MNYDALILGAGGAGLMCALTAAKRGRKVAVLDHSANPGGKILVSGGGRCNFTNLKARPENFHSQNPHFPKSALARYTPADFVKLVEAHAIPYHEKKLGQLFCDRSARDILEMLMSESRGAGVEFLLARKVESVEKTAAGFEVRTSQGPVECASLVVATGGLSFPKLGATDLGYRLARQFGLDIVGTAPALDGFVFAEKEKRDFSGLEGVAAEAVVEAGGKRFPEAALFTHLGLSGPACLQASLYWRPGQAVSVNWLPDGFSVTGWKHKSGKATLGGALSERLPLRLAERFGQLLDPKNRMLGETPNSEIEAWETRLRAWTFIPSSTAGYSRAEVTRGGVDTKDISSKTMECDKVPGLYFIGEVLDVTGELGGFNFQWAWASGHAAGSFI